MKLAPPFLVLTAAWLVVQAAIALRADEPVAPRVAPAAPPATPAAPPEIPAAAPAAAPNPPAATAEGLEYFEQRVRPLLAEHCLKCHGDKKQEAGLRLDSRAAVLKGSENGAVVALEAADGGKLLTAVRYTDENLQMPPDGKLPDEAVAVLEVWLKQGLPWTDTPAAAGPDPEAWRGHWAFQPLGQPAAPAVQRGDWVQTPIDAFILSALEQASLAPSAPADRKTLLRRLSFDLTGLPPSVDEMDAFAADTAPDATARAVERLLASPHYGERWGRFWLDYARYADTKGYVFEEDRNYPNAYKYRDWVIRALNEDLPYDQFLVQQIAADRLPTAANQDTLAALGFLTVGRRFLNNIHDIIDDRLDVLCRTTMGLTVSCARCHDHKFDPISSKDYYALYGVLASTIEPKEPAGLMTMADAPDPHNVRVFIRGNPHNQGDEVPRHFLTCLAGDKLEPFSQGSGRLELAQAITARDNPLTARVLVNRVWTHYFGAGLVRTPSDFGLRSDRPTHPELLDFLARRFMDEGWSLKKLHRLIVLSSVYQQSSAGPAADKLAADRLAEYRTRDPENRLLWKMNRRRLDLEGLRDSLLSVSGALDTAVGGPGVNLFTPPLSKRRTVYGLVERQNLPGVFRSFDFAGPDTHSPQRFNTTVPQQALFLMNSPLVSEQAKLLAARGELQAAPDAAERVSRLYRLVLARAPSADELQMAVDFVTREAAQPIFTNALWQFGHAEWDESQRVARNFAGFAHWTGTAWQGGPELPDARLDWLTLNAGGGHPGPGPAAVVRRWMAPVDGQVTIGGAIEQAEPGGNGVEAHVVSSRLGELGRWVADHARVEATVPQVQVQRGDTLDFVVTSREDRNCDSFAWVPVVRLTPGTPVPGQPAEIVFDAAAGFHGPLPTPMDSWARLAQVLLLTNEFVFLD